MAGNYDRFWSRTKGTRSQFRLEGLQPFKCTYPVHLMDIMEAGQASQSNTQRTDFTSPFKETQTKAVREYEETISQLKKENFDLKMRLYLCEEAHKETYHVRGSYNDEKEDCIQIIVKLRIEAEDLKKELKGKDEELQNSLEKCSVDLEKYKAELQEAQQKIKEQQEYLGILEQLPTPDDYNEVRRQYSEMVRDGEHTRQLLAEKDEEIETLQKEIAHVNKKVKQRDEAIRACAMKYHKEVDHIPKDLRPVIRSAIEAAVNKDEEELLSSLEALKKSLSEIMGAPLLPNLHSSCLGESHKQSSSSSRSNGSSESLPTSNASGKSRGQLSDYILEGDLDPAEIAAANAASVSYSDKSSQCDFSEIDIPGESDIDVETVSNLRNENEILMKDVEEKLKTIESLSTAYSEMERRELELNSKLDEAYTKISCLKDELEKKQNLIAKKIKNDLSCQTDIAWNSLQSSVSDKNLQEFGTSDNISELKEEILMLILAIEQKDKELSDLVQRSSIPQDSLMTSIDESYATERNELRQRLAASCDINNQLLNHLRSLERFMEDLLEQKNLSSSSLDNINESANLYSTLSSFLNTSIPLTRTLSDQLSICEELNETTLQSISHLPSYQAGPEETSKTSFICKKCQKLSQQLDDTLKEENVHLEQLKELHAENSNQQTEIENLTEMLGKKEKIIESLNKDKTTLLNDINDLEQKLAEQQRNNDLLISKQNESLAKLKKKDSLNEELRDIIGRLEMNVKDSDAACEKLQVELNQTKERLALLDEKCAKYENTLSTYSKDENYYRERISALEKREKELLENIKDMTLQKDSLLDKLKEEEKRAEKEIKKNMEMAEKFGAANQEILQLQNSNEELERQNTSLQNAKTSREKDLIAFNFEKEQMMSEIKSLQNSNEELERQNASLQNAKTSCEKDLIAFNFEKEQMMSEIKSLQNSNEELERQNASLQNAKTSSEKDIIAFNFEKEQLMSDIKSLQSSNKELERQNASLRNAKTLSEKDLISSNSQREILMSEIKSLKENIQSLESDSDSFEAKIKSLTDSKQKILDFLSNFESFFASNLKKLDDACNVKIDLNANDVARAEEMAYLVDEDKHLNVLLKNIIVENLKFQKLVSCVYQQIENVQNLEDEIYELQRAAETYKADRELLEKHESLLEQKESRLRSLEKKNGEFEETIKTLQYERSSNEQNLKSAKSEISTLQKRLLTENSREDLESILDSKKKEIDNLQEQIQTQKDMRVKCEYELLQKQKSLLEDNRNLKEKSRGLEEHVQILQNDRKKFEQSFKSKNEEFFALQKHFSTMSEDYKNSLDLKEKEINKLQECITTLQSQVNDLLSEKKNWTQRRRSKEMPEKAVSPDSSTVIDVSPDSFSQSVSQSLGSSDISCSSIKSIKNDQLVSSNTAKKDREKYMKYIKSLQSKLEAADNRIEMLEKEKNSLRENLLSYVHNGKRISSGKDKEECSTKAELESQLENKQSFIQDLKSDLYKAHDSLIDKEKEIDKLKQELRKLKKLNEDSARARQSLDSRFSDAFLLSTQASIIDLRKRKKELVNLLLDLQRQFYEAKNINLSHFEKFTQHIENLRALQVSPSMPKSESAPLLNSSSMLTNEQCRKWDRTFKNVQIDMEVDIEFLQQFKMFMTRFFSMCQSSSSEPKMDKVGFRAEPSKAVRSKENSKLTSKIVSSSAQEQMERLEPSHDRLATTACAISIKVDWIENILKTVIEEFEQLGDMEPTTDETSKETAAKLILIKLFDGLDSLLEKANEIFYMNSRLKSLELFDSDLHCGNNKHDISDQESLLSEETIALSRSASLSPVSFDGQFVVNAVHQKFKEQTLIHSKQQSPLRPSHKVIFGSQDSVFQRSHYSSPDLGIESDPNHEHSAPEQADKFHSTKISASKHDLSGSAMFRNLDKQRLSSIYDFRDSSFRFKDKSLSFTINGTLHAIGHLQDFELLKKEIAECIVGIKSILSRTGDGMQHIVNNQSPRKLQNLEYSTFKAIKDTCVNIDVCLQKANKLVNNFWVATCPTEDELRLLLQKNEEVNSKLKRTLDLKKKQEKDFKDVLDRLKQAEALKEQQEHKISKKLVKTKKLLREAEKKFLETKNRELPLLFKRSSKPFSDQL